MFANGSYAKVWEIRPSENGKTKTVRMSTSTKNQQTQEYEQDFGGFVRLVGKANKVDLKVGDKVKLISVGVTNKYVKERNTTYTNFTCFELEVQENTNYNQSQQPQNNTQPKQQPQQNNNGYNNNYNNKQYNNSYNNNYNNQNYNRNNYNNNYNNGQRNYNQYNNNAFMNEPTDSSEMPFGN